MRAREFINETTTSGSIAVISQPVGVIQRRSTTLKELDKYIIKPRSYHVTRNFKNSIIN